jgi:hypothetical protein
MLKRIALAACAASLVASAMPASAAGLASFVGTWTNNNPATRGIVKIVITLNGSTLMVNPYGACSPTPCNWGTQPATAYAPTVSSNLGTQANAATVSFNPGFATNLLTLTEQGTQLSVSDFTRFTDGSGRTNYDSTDMFHK